MVVHKLEMQNREKTAEALVSMRRKSTAIARLVHRRMCSAEKNLIAKAFGNIATSGALPESYGLAKLISPKG